MITEPGKSHSLNSNIFCDTSKGLLCSQKANKQFVKPGNKILPGNTSLFIHLG